MFLSSTCFWGLVRQAICDRATQLSKTHFRNYVLTLPSLSGTGMLKDFPNCATTVLVPPSKCSDHQYLWRPCSMALRWPVWNVQSIRQARTLQRYVPTICRRYPERPQFKLTSSWHVAPCDPDQRNPIETRSSVYTTSSCSRCSVSLTLR
ncbi:uncharacterized protein BJ212DRAFT_606031 [Suillus subaureus]|uniref:Uncharacterized protein n=1 Tax=Suillus subaureus TaxID=48587 RepID=A0A9P7J9A6_9AGAM|nr:uncharacterized protein BJ212DRAFT_606031 [Suillus subaureus]KAG1809382.1 hypothetical protein BJ212DRAFT_606031 [Suillus subaureus]